jgi:uncharacterized membrane protein YsdA (DUF1294 family)
MTRILLIAVLAANTVAFLAFGFDKWKAARGGWRVPEARLILFAFCGGAPGAWLGVKVFRHKTQKTGFLARLALVTVVNPLWPVLWLMV